nr:MAG TPA: hypothetical protein [Caudoviricetes sp.]
MDYLYTIYCLVVIGNCVPRRDIRHIRLYS